MSCIVTTHEVKISSNRPRPNQRSRHSNTLQYTTRNASLCHEPADVHVKMEDGGIDRKIGSLFTTTTDEAILTAAPAPFYPRPERITTKTLATSTLGMGTSVYLPTYLPTVTVPPSPTAEMDGWTSPKYSIYLQYSTYLHAPRWVYAGLMAKWCGSCTASKCQPASVSKRFQVLCLLNFLRRLRLNPLTVTPYYDCAADCHFRRRALEECPTSLQIRGSPQINRLQTGLARLEEGRVPLDPTYLSDRPQGIRFSN
ncbi:hypothetical protein CIB48_g6982 [Xylaria polymorpha]|nr:hypothetical protein CIB48_g6982 [Xylaria polymorpha]